MAKKKLLDYLLQVKKDQTFIIKLAFDPEKEDIIRLESALQKYDLVDMTKPEKTVFQANPLDFPNVDYGEIYIFEATFGYPTTEKFLMEDVKHVFGVEYERICIRNKNEPLYQYEEAMKEEALKRKNDGYKPKLSTEDNYSDDVVQTEPSYGNEYNKEMIEALTSDDAKERMDVYKRFNLLDEPSKKMYPDTEKDSDIVETKPIVESMDAIRKLLGVK